MTGKGFAHLIVTSVQTDRALVSHSPYQHLGCVIDGRGHLRVRPVTWPVAADRWLQTAGLVRTLKVIDRSPTVEGSLRLIEVAMRRTLQKLRFQGAVKALLFALGLRMVRLAMADGNPELQQPDAELR